jgi:hypothetical protein
VQEQQVFNPLARVALAAQFHGPFDHAAGKRFFRVYRADGGVGRRGRSARVALDVIGAAPGFVGQDVPGACEVREAAGGVQRIPLSIRRMDLRRCVAVCLVDFGRRSVFPDAQHAIVIIRHANPQALLTTQSSALFRMPAVYKEL